MIAVVLPTWPLLCWDRFTQSILVQVFLPECFEKGRLPEVIGVILFSYWCTTSSLQKGYLEIGFSHTLAHQLILEKPFKTYLTRTEKRRGVKPIWFPPPCLWLRQTLQAVRPKIHEIIKTSPFTPKCSPQSQDQWNPKGNRGISRAVQQVRLSAPAAGRMVYFLGLRTEIAPASLLRQKQNKTNTQNLSLNHYGGLFSKSWFLLSEFP